MESTTELLDDILKKLLATNAGVGAIAIVSREGLPIASAIPRGADETMVATMISSLFNLGRALVIETKKGDFEQIYIKGSSGNLLVVSAGTYAIMLFSTSNEFDKFDFNLFARLGPFRPPGTSGAASTIEEDL